MTKAHPLTSNNNILCVHSRNYNYYYTINKPSHTRPSPTLPCRKGVRMDSAASNPSPNEHKIVVIMGATGCGKTTLSMDLATRYFCGNSEIINSDKMQVYRGLDITTNKIPLSARRGVPHHLLGEFDCDADNFTPSNFRLHGGLAVEDIVSRGKLPIVVGGSNSFIYSLVVHRFDPSTNVFHWSDHNVVASEFRYNCCFIWIDLEITVLSKYLDRRVDEMIDSGMFEELCKFYKSGDLNQVYKDGRTKTGLRKAIGVEEFYGYFTKYGSGRKEKDWDQLRLAAYENAVRKIREDTCQLARRQIEKIHILSGAGWDLHRVDATEAFQELMREQETTTHIGDRNSKIKRRKIKKKKWREIWGRDVLLPSMKIVTQLLKK